MRLALFIVALHTWSWAFAQGGPPMITDDPGTPGDGHWEINVAATTQESSSGSETELPLLDINYGLGERMQLKCEVPWIWSREDGGGSDSGLGNSLLGLKVRFFDQGETGWQMSTYPQIEFRNPGSSSANRGLTEDGTTFIVPLEIRRSFQLLSANIEIGHEFHSTEEDEWTGGLVIGHDWGERVEGLLEVRGQADESFSHSIVALNLGARLALGDQWTLLLSAGREVHDTLEESSAWFAYLGLQVVR